MILKSEFKLVIGLEVHVQLNTRRKLFSLSKNEFTFIPNERVNLFDIGFPGVLPFLNHEAIKVGLLICNLLSCRIAKTISFDRKHYFYPDLPTGFQITQNFNPLGVEGEVFIPGPQDNVIKIKRVHIEQDAGKLVHHGETTKVDFNRANSPLAEIVTEPSFSSPESVVKFLKLLSQTLMLSKVMLHGMEKGGLRVDINISLIDTMTGRNTPRTEIKNMNTVKGINRAIIEERARQLDLIKNNKQIESVTLKFNEKTEKLEVMREKEAHDYRYIPEPNIAPFSTEFYGEALRTKPPINCFTNYQHLLDLGLVDDKAFAIATSRWFLMFEEFVQQNNYNKVAFGNFILDFIFAREDVEDITDEEYENIKKASKHVFEALEKKRITKLNAKNIFNSFIDGQGQQDIEKLLEEASFGLDEDNGHEKVIEALFEQDKSMFVRCIENPNLVNAIIGKAMQTDRKLNPSVLKEAIGKKILVLKNEK